MSIGLQVPVKSRRNIASDKKRNVTVIYRLNNIKVCQKVLAGTLDIHVSRLDYIRNKKTTSSGIVTPDKRGHKIPANKISTNKIVELRKFFQKFPKYVSHYSESNKTYFSPDMTKSKLYNLYKSEQQEKSVSYTVFIREFNKLNISIYKPKTDTCSKCDMYNATKEKAEEHREHLKRASDARKYMKDKESLGKEREDILVISFDMQKTQPMPHIQTSVAFYKRQLWLYNLGINNRATNKGTMCLWTEVQGKRGSNEVGSALLEYLRGIDLSKIKEIYSFSDGCGGQNKNKTIVSTFMNVCQNTPVETWTHSFLESGHSYLPNDVDFGKIERKKKYNSHIYDEIAWEELISECNFPIIKMEGKFKNLSSLCQDHYFRSVDLQQDKFSWLKMKWLQVNGENSVMSYRNSCNEEEPIKTIDFTPRIDNDGSKLDAFELPNIYIDPPKISQAKYKDIQSLLPYIPPIHHSYFQNLPHVTSSSQTEELEYIDDFL